MSKISVIVPIYKVEKYLARCVDSILAQTFSDYELILVDDGSPDNCPKICDEYAAKYDFIRVIHKENGGLSDARNFGIDYAMTTESEWITFIDSDDWVHPQYLEILYNACIENNVKISCCGLTRVNSFSEKEISDNYCNEIIVDSIEEIIEKHYDRDLFNNILAWARIYKKTLWKAIRFPIGKLFEDALTIYKVLYQCNKIALVNNRLYYYFNNENSIMNSRWTNKKLFDNFYALIDALHFYYNNNYIISFYDHFEHLFFNFTNAKTKVSGKKDLNKLKSAFRHLLKKYKKNFPFLEYEDYYLHSYSVFWFRFKKANALIKREITKIFRKS